MFPAPFRLFFIAVPLLVAAGALAMAAFPRRMTRWQMRSPDGTTRIEPSSMRILLMRVMGVVVAALALLMVFANAAILP